MSMGPTAKQIRDWQDRIETRLQEYQRQVSRLRSMVQLPEGEVAEWDRLESFTLQSERITVRLRGLAGRVGENWAESCFDQAHDLCAELEDWTETVRVLIACGDDGAPESFKS